MKSKHSIGQPAPTRGLCAHYPYDAAVHPLTLITSGSKLIGLTRDGGRIHSGSAPVVGGGGDGSGEVPTLPECGAPFSLASC